GESSQSTYYGEATTWPSSGNSGSLLPAPTGVNAYKLSSDEAYVWWNPVSGAKEYVVYWASSETGTYYYDGTTNDTSFISTNWGGGYAYFKIAAVNNAGYEGALSAPVSVYLGWSYYSVGTVPVEKMGTIRRTE
ncbi:MAG: hypothetical protein LBK43_08330, partial [Treponema sp.]|nr:hypothetical protein [Treponema sp.]